MVQTSHCMCLTLTASGMVRLLDEEQSLSDVHVAELYIKDVNYMYIIIKARDLEVHIENLNTYYLLVQYVIKCMDQVSGTLPDANVPTLPSHFSRVGVGYARLV